MTDHIVPPLPYIPSQPPVIASISNHAKVISAFAYPISDATIRKAPLKNHEVQSQRGIETALVWGWALARIDRELSERVMGEFRPQMKDQIRIWDDHFRQSFLPMRRGRNLAAGDRRFGVA